MYDTTESRYIALEDIRRLVVDGNRVQVTDARTGEDITRGILLQIIVEQEERGQPVLSTELLEKVIRFYGDALQALMATYLERSLDAFMQQHQVLRRQVNSLLEQAPLDVMAEMAERNLALWRNLQESLYRGFADQQAGDEPRRDPEKP